MDKFKYPTSEVAQYVVNKLCEAFTRHSIYDDMPHMIQINPLPKFDHIWNFFICRDGSTTEYKMQLEIITRWSAHTHDTPLSPKSLDGHKHKYMRDSINRFLGTDLTEEHFKMMYTMLSTKEAAAKFIDSGFSTEYLEQKYKLYQEYINY